jgi:hypothetical protein
MLYDTETASYVSRFVEMAGKETDLVCQRQLCVELDDACTLIPRRFIRYPVIPRILPL